MNNDSILEWVCELQALVELLDTPQAILVGLIKTKLTRIGEAC